MGEYAHPEAWQDGVGDMSGDEFRRYGRQIVDWIADYLDNAERYPVLSRLAPGELRASLPDRAPETGESMDTVLRDFERIVLPGITHWNHPAFFAYFAITGSAPGILGEMLTAALNVNGMVWRSSPAATELEAATTDWLRELLGLDSGFEGIVYDTASISSLVAIATAREAIDLDVRLRGLAGRPDIPKLRLYCSEEAHSSIEKAAITLGLGQQSVRKIETDDEFRLDVNALRGAIAEDVEAGALPFCVVAVAGTTSTTSVDPIPAIADVCAEYHLWLHVDAAYGGAAAILPEMRWVLQGTERADSLVINPHKWLFTPIDISVLYCRRLESVRDAFSLVPEYLRTPEDNTARNYMDYGPQLGRRFRALKLWFVIRAFGREGISARLREHIRLAQLFANWIESDPAWELAAPVPMSTVCFRSRRAGWSVEQLDALNQRIMDGVNATGEAFLSHTRLHDRLTLRLAVGNLRTTERHVRRVWELLQRKAAEQSVAQPH